MSQEFNYILIAAQYLATIRDSNSNAHALRLRCAKRVLDAVNIFIYEEVNRATHKSRTDESSMTWGEVGQVLGLSKSATYARYGGKSERRVR